MALLLDRLQVVFLSGCHAFRAWLKAAVFLLLFGFPAQQSVAQVAPSSGDRADPVQRPREPWVFAGSMDDRARVVFVALHRDLWIAYDTENGDLFKAWRGGIVYPDGSLNAFSRGNATASGLVYMENETRNPWLILRNDEVSSPGVTYRGYRIVNDVVTIDYILTTDYGHRIRVEETPEVVYHPDGRPGLQRRFQVYDLPAGFQVALALHLKTLESRDDLQTDGLLQREGEKTNVYIWGKTYDIQGRLLLEAGKITTVASYFTPQLLRNLQQTAAPDALDLFRHTRLFQGLSNEDAAGQRLQRRSDHEPGISVRVYGIGEAIERLAELAPGQLPAAHYVANAIDLHSKEDFGGLDFYFISQLDGFLNVAAPGEFRFRVLADDGVRVRIADSLLIERNGLQPGREIEEARIYLDAGVHPFRVDHFQSTGPKQLTIYWKPPWSDAFDVLSAPVLSTKHEEQRLSSVGRKFVLRAFQAHELDVDRKPVDGPHPSMTFEMLETPGLEGQIGGLDFLSDGRLAAAAWKGSGEIAIVEGLLDDLVEPQVRVVARGLRRPMGLQIVDDEMFVLQEQELTQLIDLDGNDEIDEYRAITHDWALSTDYSELALGLDYDDGFFYGALSMPIDAAGAIFIEEVEGRGRFVRFGSDGRVQPLTDGIQVANGMSRDSTGLMLIADQRNPWFSDSRILVADADAMQGDRLDRVSLADPLRMGSIWLPSALAGDAPTQPVPIGAGVFKGQWMYGDLNGNRMHRVSLDQVNGAYQGAAYRFSEGLPFPLNRLIPIPGHAGEWIGGGLRFDEPWKLVAEEPGGLMRIVLDEDVAFEIESVRVRADGFEISFTMPVDNEQGARRSAYRVYRWPTGEDRRRGSEGIEKLDVKAVHLSADGRSVHLELAEMAPGYVVYINLDPMLESESGEALWSNEAWYSLNVVPQVNKGILQNVEGRM